MHFNIIKYSNRPFELSYDGVINNIVTIGQNYNNIIKDEDLVIHLGDLTHGRQGSEERIAHIIQNLKGRKILIKGNHDKFHDKFYKKHFESVQKYLIIGDTFFCHYPCYNHPSVQLVKEERKLLKVLQNTNCTKIFHGHIHDKDPSLWESDGYKRTNFSVDFAINNYTPIKITDPNLINILFDKYK